MALNTDVPAWLANQQPFDTEMFGQMAGSLVGAGINRWNTQRNPELTDMAKAQARKTPFLQSWANAYKQNRINARDPLAADKWQMAQDEFKLKEGEYQLRKSTWEQSVKDKADEQSQWMKLGQWNGEGPIPEGITFPHVFSAAVEKQRGVAQQKAAKGLSDIEEQQNRSLNAIGSDPNVPQMIRSAALNGIMGMTPQQKANFLAQNQKYVPKLPELGETKEIIAGGKPATVVRTGPTTGRVVTQADTLEEKGQAALSQAEKKAEVQDRYATRREERQAKRAEQSESRKAQIQIAVNAIKELTAGLVKKRARLSAYSNTPNDPTRKTLEADIAADEVKIAELESKIGSSSSTGVTSGGVKFRRVQ